MTPLDGKAVASFSISNTPPAGSAPHVPPAHCAEVVQAVPGCVPPAQLDATALVGASALTPQPASGLAALREQDSPGKCGGEAMVQIPVSASVSEMPFLPARMAKGVLALQVLLTSY